jgi:tetratricopeptide (TPR) repeat protein
MIQRFLLFLGPARARALFLLIGATGLLSLMLNVIVSEAAWVRPAQTLLAIAALVGSLVLIIGRLDSHDHGRWLGVLIPALGAVLLGAIFLPQFLPLLIGAAVGWVVVGLFVFRSRAPMSMQRAVKHFRRSEFADAFKEIDALIKDEPQNPNHYRFRAEVLRVWGKLDRAKRDYLKMTELAPDAPDAYNGLAEVLLQAGDYRGALDAAKKAAALAPNEWVALYNLGMIEDRLGQSEEVLKHLDQALALRVQDARHRALIHFYRTRAYARLGDETRAREALDLLKRHRLGLEEWDRIVSSEQAETLRVVLGEDIARAQEVANGQIDVMRLAQGEAK